MNINITNLQNKVMMVIGLYGLLILNVYSTRINNLSYLVIMGELLILGIFLLKRDMEKYYLSLLIFISCSFEVTPFIYGVTESNREYFSIVNTPFGGPLLLAILSIVPIILLTGNIKKINITKSSKVRNYLLMLTILFVVGIIATLVTYLSNDNNINNLYFFRFYFMNDLLMFVFIFFMSTNLILILTNNSLFRKKIEETIVLLYIAFMLAAFTTIVLGFNGYYGVTDKPVLLMPLAVFFGICFFIFPIYSDYKREYRYLLLGILFFIISILLPLPLGGKWWLIIMTIPFIVLFNYFKGSFTRKKFLLLLSLFILVIIFIFLLANNYINVYSKEFEGKLGQAMNVVMFWKEDWFINLPLSPKYRIDEFINVSIEFIKKPEYLLFGKGFGGSLQHHTNLLSWNDSGSFSITEIQNNIFFRLHESVNYFFLKFGLFGLFFFIQNIIVIIKNIKRSPFFIISIFWLLFYFNVYFSMVIGLVCFIISLQNADEKDGLNIEQ